MKVIRIAGAALLVSVALALSQTWDTKISPARKEALEHISASNLRGNLSFLASDALEGRGTPSRGLDLAAEFIASRFRQAGLEPVGDDGYFQTTTVKSRPPRSADPNAPVTEPQDVKVRNVVGLLRGSDEKLKDTYILVSGHYDHLGMNPNLQGDQIFNGANDDGSGTVGVIELANAIGAMKVKPKRSIVFICFYGEERGLLGSTYYGQHPIFPLAKTVAGINLEHMGRTDDTEGPRIGELSMTGYDYSDIGTIFSKAGAEFGVKVTKHPKNSDPFFMRSDNRALAAVGIPSHTLCTAFIFPDYHKVSDTWDKVDYDNLAKVLKAACLCVLTIADSTQEPKWNESNPKTAQYVEAWKKLKVGG